MEQHKTHKEQHQQKRVKLKQNKTRNQLKQ